MGCLGKYFFCFLESVVLEYRDIWGVFKFVFCVWLEFGFGSWCDSIFS